MLSKKTDWNADGSSATICKAGWQPAIQLFGQPPFVYHLYVVWQPKINRNQVLKGRNIKAGGVNPRYKARSNTHHIQYFSNSFTPSRTSAIISLQRFSGILMFLPTKIISASVGNPLKFTVVACSPRVSSLVRS